jgi:hypothetical protein
LREFPRAENDGADLGVALPGIIGEATLASLNRYLLPPSNHLLCLTASAHPFPDIPMTAIDRTAYPLPGTGLTREELGMRYDLTEADLAFVQASARGDTGRPVLATLLKRGET